MSVCRDTQSRFFVLHDVDINVLILIKWHKKRNLTVSPLITYCFGALSLFLVLNMTLTRTTGRMSPSEGKRRNHSHSVTDFTTSRMHCVIFTEKIAYKWIFLPQVLNGCTCPNTQCFSFYIKIIFSDPHFFNNSVLFLATPQPPFFGFFFLRSTRILEAFCTFRKQGICSVLFMTERSTFKFISTELYCWQNVIICLPQRRYFIKLNRQKK